jgi:hypothetical protein
MDKRGQALENHRCFSAGGSVFDGQRIKKEMSF